MDPGTAMLVAGGLSALVGGLKGGGQKFDKKQAAWLEKIGHERETLLKPKTPYYETKSVPYMSDLAQRLIMGNLSTRLGGDLLKKYGINLEDYKNVAGLNTPYSQNPEVSKYYPQYSAQQQTPGMTDWRSQLLQKYGAGENIREQRGRGVSYAA
jgi:hypothetical protein